MTAIRATYSDLKLVKTRKILQLIFEVPIEEADNALRVLGGMPRADKETWVGIAPITEEAATRPPEKPHQMADHNERIAREREESLAPEKPCMTWEETPLVKQAAIRCGDFKFQQWLAAGDKQDAIEAVRRICEVQSRSELATDDEAAERWRNLDRDFLARPRG